MNDATQYAVFLFPQAMETLGAVIKPYLTEEATVGPHIVCSEVDASGGFFLLKVQGRKPNGEPIEAELMVPNAFVKLVVSVHSEHAFGFGTRAPAEHVEAAPK